MPKKYYVFEYSDIDRALAAGNPGDIIRYEPNQQRDIAVFEIEMSNGRKFKTEIGDMNGFDDEHENYNAIDYTEGKLPHESYSRSSSPIKRKRVNSTRSSSSRSPSRSPKKVKTSGGRKSRRAKKSKKARSRKTKRRY